MEDARCVRCGRTISRDEMEDGLVVETENGFYCSDCVAHLQGAQGPATDVPLRAGEEEDIEQPVPPPTASPAAAPLAGPETSDEDDPIVILRSILAEVKPIHRAIMYEKASVWNVLGGIAQIFALGAVLLLPRWSDQWEGLLLLACFLQLLALTFFVKGK